MKNRKVIFGMILLLFAISGLCNVINVSAEEIEMPPTSYYAQGFDVVYQDELEIYVSSSGVINTYIMTEEQYGVLKDSGGLTWNYLKRWKDMTYLDYTYTIPADGIYYVIVYNKDLFSERIVNIEITVDYLSIIDDSYIMRNVLFFIIIPIAIIGVVIIGYIIFKKKTPKEPIIQIKEIPKITYCLECGIKVTDITKDYCSNCGSKLIKS